MQGVVTTVGVDTLEAHVYDPSPQHKCYLPAWECKGKPDKNQKKRPAKGYTAERLTFDVTDLELVTKLTPSYKIPAHAWLSLKATGIVLPLEFTAKAETAAVTTAVVMVSKAVRRPSRRQRLTMRKGDLQHAWVQIMLRQRGIVVHGDPLLDHGRLMHHLIYGTYAAPSGAMMDEDYATILGSVGGADEGNMVLQMQSIVCSQVNPAVPSIFPIDACWDGTGAAENTVYDDMLLATQHDEYVDDEQHGTGESGMDEALKTAEQEVPTAPEWDDDAGSDLQTHSEMCETVNGPIQCTVMEPAHTTSTAVTALAVIGGVSLMVTVSILIALYWLSLQGIQVTGFWLTLKPEGQGPRNYKTASL